MMRSAIICIRPDLCPDPEPDIEGMRALAALLRFDVERVVQIDPAREDPWTTVSIALWSECAEAALTLNVEHVAGIAPLIRQRVPLIMLATLSEQGARG